MGWEKKLRRVCIWREESEWCLAVRCSLCLALEAHSLECPEVTLQGQRDLPGHESTAATGLQETKLACLHSSWQLGQRREWRLVQFCFAKGLLQLCILSEINLVCSRVMGSELAWQVPWLWDRSSSVFLLSILRRVV